ncbi:hypothetical protein X798_01499 [Onchocerca flexuosa]|uniref:Ovule protein n=2 Tax=Onchocerca flexuosa TaxID=387005 RepID=A0A183H6E1_9BILA|nr:hypothetical protein X798_01499 [Onchocerca flexuosa]VDO35091.1 unnamed protein product [Onchocerca flexuosa]
MIHELVMGPSNLKIPQSTHRTIVALHFASASDERSQTSKHKNRAVDNSEVCSITEGLELKILGELLWLILSPLYIPQKQQINSIHMS